jgi:excisionase family DNA binding protein
MAVKYLTVKEIQKILGYKRADAIYKWLRSGELKAYRPGNHKSPWKIQQDDFENFMHAGR